MKNALFLLFAFFVLNETLCVPSKSHNQEGAHYVGTYKLSGIDSIGQIHDGVLRIIADSVCMGINKATSYYYRMEILVKESLICGDTVTFHYRGVPRFDTDVTHEGLTNRVLEMDTLLTFQKLKRDSVISQKILAFAVNQNNKILTLTEVHYKLPFVKQKTLIFEKI